MWQIKVDISGDVEFADVERDALDLRLCGLYAGMPDERDLCLDDVALLYLISQNLPFFIEDLLLRFIKHLPLVQTVGLRCPHRKPIIAD